MVAHHEWLLSITMAVSTPTGSTLSGTGDPAHHLRGDLHCVGDTPEMVLERGEFGWFRMIKVMVHDGYDDL